jgi:hypothetical protein
VSGSFLPPGWHPDPDDKANLRYWDGESWTDRVVATAKGPAASGERSKSGRTGANKPRHNSSHQNRPHVSPRNRVFLVLEFFASVGLGAAFASVLGLAIGRVTWPWTLAAVAFAAACYCAKRLVWNIGHRSETTSTHRPPRRNWHNPIRRWNSAERLRALTDLARRRKLIAGVASIAVVLACITVVVVHLHPGPGASARVGPDSAAELRVGSAQVRLPAGAVAGEGRISLKVTDGVPESAVRDAGMSAHGELASVTLEDTELIGRAQVSFEVPSSWDKSLRPVVVWQDRNGGWRWLPTTLTTENGVKSALATTDHFSSGFLAAFDVKAAADRVLNATKNFVGGRAGVDEPKCVDEKKVRELVQVSSDDGDQVKWCLGLEKDRPLLRVTNNRRSAVQVDVPWQATITSSEDYGFSIEQFSNQFSKGMGLAYSKNQVFIVAAGKTVDFELPASGKSFAKIKLSMVSLFMSVLVNAVDTYVIIASAGKLPVKAKGDQLWNLFGTGVGSKADWAQAGIGCFRDFTSNVTNDMSRSRSVNESVGAAMKFAGDCGTKLGSASIHDSGTLGWIGSTVISTVASIFSIIYSLVEDLVIMGHEIADNLTTSNSVYDISITPKATDETAHDGELSDSIQNDARTTESAPNRSEETDPGEPHGSCYIKTPPVEGVDTPSEGDDVYLLWAFIGGGGGDKPRRVFVTYHIGSEGHTHDGGSYPSDGAARRILFELDPGEAHAGDSCAVELRTEPL